MNTRGHDLTCKGSSDAGPKCGPRIATRLMSRLVGLYLRYSPIVRGKWWLRRRASAWLVARLDTGPWIRVSGVAEFEWRTLLGAEIAEDATAAAFGRFLKPGQTIIDVGANVGYFSLMAAAQVGPFGRVIAFEPNPAAANRLHENAALNSMANLEIVEAAVADKPGGQRLFLAEDSEGSSLYDVGFEANRAILQVPVTTLDDHLEAKGLGKVDLLKIDAEGAEVRVLSGAQRLLSCPSAPAIFIEANPLTLRAAGESVEALRSKLESFGYTIMILEKMKWLGIIAENWLATKREQSTSA